VGGGAAAEPGVPRLWARVLAIACLVLPQASVLLVQGAAPLLLREAPLVLLALHPFAPWSLLVSSRTDLLPFLAVMVLVRTLPCCGDYLVGRWYGTRALDWLSRKPRTRRLTTAGRRLSVRAGGALLVLYPGAAASVLAGANGMPVRRFAPLMVTGIVLSAVLARLLATAAAGPLTAAADWVDDHVLLLGGVLAAGVLLGQLGPWARRRRS
jgi:membrane protein DedA with SNARE-associated domain